MLSLRILSSNSSPLNLFFNYDKSKLLSLLPLFIFLIIIGISGILFMTYLV